MQPLNPKLTNKAKGLARAKMLIQTHLFWLKGFPTVEHSKVYWICPLATNKSSEKITITPEIASKAHRTINELLRDFPIALPKIVGDIHLWSTRCKEYLDFYKLLIKQPCESMDYSLFDHNSEYQSKVNRYLVLIDHNNNIVSALSWVYYVDRKPLPKLLGFIQQFGEKLHKENLTLKHSLLLCHLYGLEGPKAKGVINFILNNVDNSVLTKISNSYFQNYLQCKIKKSKKPKPFYKPDVSQGTTSKTVLDLLSWITDLKTTQRRSIMSIINAIDISTSINLWHVWWQKTDVICNKIETMVCYADKSKGGALKTLQKQLRNLKATRPEDFSLLTYIGAIQSTSKSKAWTQALIQLLSSLPKQRAKKGLAYPRKLEFVVYFNMIYAYGDIKDKNLAIYIIELAKFIKSNPEGHESSPWKKLEKYYWGAIESTIIEYLKPGTYNNFFTILNQILPQTKVSSYDLNRLIRIVSGKFNTERTVELTLFLLDKKLLGDVSSVVIKITKHYDLKNSEIAKIAKIWSKFDEEYTDDDTLEVMFDTFVAIGAADIFKDLLFAGFASQLRQECYLIRIIKKITSNNQVPIFQEAVQKHNPWVNDYPQEFNESLLQLNSISLTAENKTKKIFSSHWWPKAMIETQIAALEKQLEKLEDSQQEKLKPRLNSLIHKLEHHKAITPAEEKRISTKISEQVILQKYNNWQNQLTKKFQTIWLDFFQLEQSQTPAWFFNDDIIQKLLPIIDFKSKDRQLAIKVILNRCLTTNWNFEGHHKNKQFLKVLQKLRVDTKIWIDGIKAKTFQAKDASPITILIIKDPLEILNMGGHFKTCLSPGSFNYFSVFANIADINKQVIYAKNSKGKVVGRVLVGLTETGGLKVFHRYFHNAQDKFEEFSIEYIKNWATKAGLILTRKGDVKTIIASNWYDDGAITIDNGIECFKDDSMFRKNMLTIDVDIFQDELKQNLKPFKINGLTFSLLLQLPEISKNKALFPVLVDIANDIKHIDVADKISLYKLSHSMGHKNYYKYFRNDVIKYQAKKMKTEKRVDIELALLMAENNPSDALNLIKKYGRLISKNWEKNLGQDTHKVAVKALNRLGRTQKALEIEKDYQK